MPDVPDRPRRIRVMGVSGSGKTSLGREIARRTGLPHLELDAVFWAAGWTFRDVEEARTLVRAFVAAHPGGWVIDGNWRSRLDGLLDPGTPGGADVVVWLDHPRPLVMARVVRRTLWRGLRREELWHGNRERVSGWFRRDPEQNIMLWAWTQHAATREQITREAAQGRPLVRLTGQRAVDAWLDRLDAGTRGRPT